MKINNFDEQYLNYLFITYIVTSKPKRISVAAGFVHMVKPLIKCLMNYLERFHCRQSKDACRGASHEACLVIFIKKPHESQILIFKKLEA